MAIPAAVSVRTVLSGMTVMTAMSLVTAFLGMAVAPVAMFTRVRRSMAGPILRAALPAIGWLPSAQVLKGVLDPDGLLEKDLLVHILR